MWKAITVFGLLALGLASATNANEAPSLTDKKAHNAEVAENQLTTQIFAILEHYKQDDPVGLPGAPVPDPFPVPDVKKNVGVGVLTMKNTLAYGMSKFRVTSIKTDLNALTVRCISVFIPYYTIFETNHLNCCR